MAEVVELAAEQIISELELIAEILHFNENETRTITKKLKEFEYKLQRHTKCKKDILQYIQYEVDLMKLIKQKPLDKGLNQKKYHFECVITNHIIKLYNVAIKRFPSNVKIWLSYTKFCIQVSFYTFASRILAQMLELHGDKPSLFKVAAQYEFEECHCVEKARKILLNGLHLHEDSRLLYREAFKLELNFANMKRKELRSENKIEGVKVEEDPLLQGKLAEVIYDLAFKKVNDVTFVVELFKLTKDYDFTGDLQKKILLNLGEKFSTEELTWDTLARKELEYSSNSDSTSKPSLKERIQNCTAMFETALKTLNTERMWKMYIDKMLELCEDTSKLIKFKRNCLIKAFIGAHNQGMMSEEYYLTWANLVKVEESEGSENVYNVLREGTKKLQASVSLWEARLKYHFTVGDDAGAVKVFREAIQALDETALPIWKLMLLYYQATSPTKVEELFREGIAQNCSVISNSLKVMLLEWLTLNRGIVAARKQYAVLSLTPPFFYELHKKMLDLEDLQPRPLIKHIRKCHHNITTHFGHQNTDVWMAWVRFEQAFGEPKNVNEIYAKAVRSLQQSQLVDIFISEFTLNKAEKFSSPQVKSDPDNKMDVS